MSNAKFTKGPWCIDGDDFDRECYRTISGKGHGALADVVWQMEDDKNTGDRSLSCEANAHLISAAPELYDAIEGLLACISETRGESSYGAVQDALKALAKARGKL